MQSSFAKTRRFVALALLGAALAAPASGAGDAPVVHDAAPVSRAASIPRAPSIVRAAGRARVELRSGRVVVESPGAERPEVLARGAPVDVVEGARIEVGAGAEVVVDWTGALGLRIVGPASLAWSHERDAGPLDLVWTARAPGVLHAEVRGGEPRFDLGSGWIVAGSRGLFRVAACASGTRVENLAGAPLRLARRASPFVAPARELRAGVAVEIAPTSGDERRPRPARESAPAWPVVDWPFGRVAAATDDAAQPAAASAPPRK